jgi:hypothetical protein
MAGAILFFFYKSNLVSHGNISLSYVKHFPILLQQGFVVGTLLPHLPGTLAPLVGGHFCTGATIGRL